MIKQIKIEFTTNKDLDPISLDKIVSLKMQHWNYKKVDQKRWISENIADNDYHLMLNDNRGEIIAYLNIVNLNINIEKAIKFYLGVGNVCVNKEFGGNGYGMLIMNAANFFIKNLGLPGILLCKESLNNFYQKTGWVLYKGDAYLDNVAYYHSVFVTKSLISPSINIEKNF